jgi:hypothetical protein
MKTLSIMTLGILLCFVLHFYGYAECRYAECRYADCRGAHLITWTSGTVFTKLHLPRKLRMLPNKLDCLSLENLLVYRSVRL